jgi:hypothetical protein
VTRASLIFLLSCLPGLVIADTRPKEVSPKALAMITDRYEAIANTEKTNRKLKFPVIDNGVLVYLIDETEKGKYWYTAHKLPELLARKDWFGAPLHTTDKLHGEEVDEWDGTDQKNRPRAFFPGPSVLRIDPENGQTIDWLGPDRPPSAKFLKSKRPLRDLSSPKNGQPPVFVDDVGVHRGDNVLFRCGEATTYGEAGDKRVVAYYDANLTPLVAILARDISDTTDCTNITSRVPGISPTLSPSGNYLAVASARQNDETRDIRIFFIGSSPDPTEVYFEKSVDIYDIKTDVFKFPNSMAWFGADQIQTLHFRRTGQRETLLIRRIRCSGTTCREIGDLKIPPCLSYRKNIELFYPDGELRIHDREPESRDIFRNIIIKPLTKCGALDTTASNTIVVDKVSWFDVAEVNGRMIMAIQAIVKIVSSGTGEWSSRILIFEIPDAS